MTSIAVPHRSRSVLGDIPPGDIWRCVHMDACVYALRGQFHRILSWRLLFILGEDDDEG